MYCCMDKGASYARVYHHASVFCVLNPLHCIANVMWSGKRSQDDMGTGGLYRHSGMKISLVETKHTKKK